MDENGEPIFEQMDTEQAVEMLSELGEDADILINNALKSAKAAYEAAMKKKPKATSFHAIKAEREAITQEQAQTKATYEAWTAIKDGILAKRNSNNGSAFSSVEKVEGARKTRTMPNGQVLKGRYVLVPAESLIPSHNPMNGWKSSEGFPLNEKGQNVNDRDYEHNEAAQQHTEQISRKYDGQAVDKVPTISQDGLVYDGNGRTMAGQLAAVNNTDTEYMQALRDNAETFGFTPEQVDAMPHGRVVFMLDEALPFTTETFAMFNAEDKKTENNTEQAVANSKRLSEEQVMNIASVIDEYSTLDSFFQSEKGAAEVMKTLQNVGLLGQNEVAGMLDNGMLNAKGREYLTSLLLGAILEEKAIREASANPQLKDTILRAIKAIIANRQLKEFALTEEISNAISLLYEAKKANMPLVQYLRQTNMFEGSVRDRYSDFDILLATAMDDSVSTFRDVLSKYNQSASDVVGGQFGIFAEGGGITTKEDVKQLIVDYYGQKQSEATGTESATESRTEPGTESTESGTESTEETDSRTSEGHEESNAGEGVQGRAAEEVALSEEEDDYGNKFVLSSNGTTEFGFIGKETGLREGEIKLSVGDPNYGLVHLEKKHGKQIRSAGFKDVLTFVEYVCKHYQRIKLGETPTGELNGTYLIQIEDAHNNTLYIQLSKDGSYWKINSGGVFRKGYGKGKKEIWSASEGQNKLSATDGSLRNEDKSDHPTNPNGNEPHISINKDSKAADKNQETSVKDSDNKGNIDEKSAQQCKFIADQTGLDEAMLKELVASNPTEKSLNEFGAYDKLIGEVDADKSKAFVEKVLGKAITDKMVIPFLDNIMRKFILAPSQRDSIIEKVENKTFEEGTSTESSDVLTIDEIEASDLDQITKDGAKSYLEGNINFATSIAYQKTLDYVRNRTEHTESSSSTDNGTLVDASVSTNERGTGRSSGRETDRVDGQPSKEGDKRSGESVSSTSNSENDSPISAGKPSNRTTGNEETSTDGVSSRDPKSKRSSNRSGKRNDGESKSRSKRSSRKSIAKDERGKLAAERNEIIDELNDLLDDFVKAGRDTLSVSLLPFNGKQLEIAGKMLVVGVKLGYTYIKEGICNFREWKDKMREKLYVPFSEVMHLTDAQVDEFINDMWDYPFTIGKETRLLKEWASVMEHDKLRSAVKDRFAEKREAQKAAENIPVEVCNMQNIVETLPYLLPQQQEDVRRAETQFFDQSHQDRVHGNGKGYLFTNGTGTGKTYTGLGIVKRFIKQGKGRILILTPSQAKVSDWIKDAKNLGIDVTALQDTKDKGKGVVVTTFANLRSNKALMEDMFDLIVYDESHRIMENKGGNETIGAKQHYMLSNKNAREALNRLKLNDPYFIEREKKIAEYKSASEELGKLKRAEHGSKLGEDGKAKIDQLTARLKELDKEVYHNDKEVKAQEERLMPEAEKAAKNTKVVFLSATPFNTIESLAYTEGYIFSYPEENQSTIGRYTHRSPREEFLEQNFGAGYRFRYGRLEQHIENAEALSQQEIVFSDYLENQLGTKSGRIIDSEYDYSRDFPSVTLDMAPLFNSALQDVFGAGSEFGALRESFFDVLYDYNYSTALFETMKISAIMPRIKEHLAMGRKVVIFHRRKATQAAIRPPFSLSLSMAIAKAEALDDNFVDKREEQQAILHAVEAFKKKYANLLEYEKKLDYSMPREQVAKVFGEENVLFFSGSESAKKKNEAIEQFNSDDSGKNIIVIQEASGKEGISLHDTTGEHQRVLITLALPQSPITALQIEGRIYRIGNKSNAIFEYPLLGLHLETNLFGQKFNQQVSTTENLALGSNARNLRMSFAEGVLLAHTKNHSECKWNVGT